MKKVFTTTIKALGDRQVETIASTAALDREHDRILASAWRLEAYKTNPAVLWAHDYTLPPIAVCREISVSGGALRTVDEFVPRRVFPLADTIHDLVKSGAIRAKSVGFRPLTWKDNAEGGRDYTAVELLEHSYVPVPANVECLVLAKSKGLDRLRLDAFLKGFGLDSRREPEDDVDLDWLLPRTSGVPATDVRDVVESEEMTAWLRDEAQRCARAAVRRHTPLTRKELATDLEWLMTQPLTIAGFSAAEIAEGINAAIPALVGPAIARARGRID